jgi:hypothetical protein
VVPPLLAWLLANACYWAAADRGGFDYLLVRTHARWDSGNYLNIARRGYTLAHCTPRVGSPFTPAAWCGTAGWFPLYRWPCGCWAEPASACRGPGWCWLSCSL